MPLKELAVLWGSVTAVVALSSLFAKEPDPAPAVPFAEPTAMHAGPLAAAGVPVAARKPNAAAPLRATDFLEHANPRRLNLRSDVALVFDETDGMPLYERNGGTLRPIASLTKLMTALVVLDAGLSLDEQITVTDDDRDRLRGSRSRLPLNTVLSRRDLLLAALAASDNRAAAALARTFPGGTTGFIAAMNQKAQQLGMTQSRFTDAAGLDRGNLSSARDLVKLVAALDVHPLIAELSTSDKFYLVDRRNGRRLTFINTNRFVRGDRWNIALSKTGYTSDAGYCLVMRTTIADRPITVVLLNSWGTHSKYGDANRIRDWVSSGERAARKAMSTLAQAQL